MIDLLQLLLLAHAGATLAMMGLIWFVQLVHYPLFAELAPDRSAAYAGEHARRTTWIVAPLMALEVVTAAALLAFVPTGWPQTLALVGAVLVGVNWASTFFIQVPCHQRLARGTCSATIRRLVVTNWIRTFAWTARGAVALALLALLRHP